MSKQHEIEVDPYAQADAAELWTLLKPLLRVLQKLPNEIRLRAFSAAESEMRAVADTAEVVYFDCLRSLPPDVTLDSGKHPANFIEAQLRFPKLRRLYVVRRVSRCMHYFLEMVVKGPDNR